jgi:uncharacterized protein with GYD domain
VRRRTVLPVLAATLLALCLPASARDPKADYALIFITVFGPDDRAVAGVRVKVRRADKKKAQWEQYSDRRGEIGFRVPVGAADYLVWADLKDRQLAEKTVVKVHIDGNERQDAFLHLTEDQVRSILKR